MKPARIAWYMRRARTMEPGELGARAAGAFESVLDFVRLQVSGRSGFERTVRPGDYVFCTSRLPMLPPFEWRLPPSAAAIDALLAGEYSALGHPWRWQAGGGAWHIAPDTGSKWGRGYTDFIRHRPGNGIGDIRVTWEPNRLQQLVALALVARALPDQSAVATALLRQQLLCWIAANPMRRGVNYASAMECALRILSVAFASDLARPVAAF